MSTQIRHFEQSANRLNSLLAAEDLGGISKALQEMTLQQACSEEFIDFLCIRRQDRLVVLLTTLALENGLRSANTRRLLDLYQSTLQGQVSGELQQLPQRHILRQVLAATLAGGAASAAPTKEQGPSERPIGSEADIQMATAFLLDHGQQARALDLIRQRWVSGPVDAHKLMLLRILLTRHRHASLGRSSRESLISCTELIHSRLAAQRQFPDLQDSAALLLADTCFQSKAPLRAVDWTARIRDRKVRLKSSFFAAMALAKEGQWEAGVARFDELLEALIPMPAEWVQENFKAPGGNKAERDNFPLEMAKQALEDLQSILDGMGKKAFICWGTLLGYARVGNFLSHDKDIDVGIIDEASPMDIVCRLFESGLFKPHGSTLKLDELCYTAVAHIPTGVSIDVSFFMPRQGHLVTNIPVDLINTPRWFRFDPMEVVPAEFVGIRTHVPKDIDRFLTQAYGQWRVPDPYFWTLTDSLALTDIGSINFLLMARVAMVGAFAKNSPEHAFRALKLLRQHPDKPASMSPRLVDLLESHFRAKAQVFADEGKAVFEFH